MDFPARPAAGVLATRSVMAEGHSASYAMLTAPTLPGIIFPLLPESSDTLAVFQVGFRDAWNDNQYK
jgi:hypothetical protein